MMQMKMKVVVLYLVEQGYPWDCTDWRGGKVGLQSLCLSLKELEEFLNSPHIDISMDVICPSVMQTSYPKKLFSIISMLAVLPVSQTWSD